jgi:hypothetical protein
MSSLKTVKNIRQYLFSGRTAYGELAPAPIPTALWLFGSGLLGLIGLARKKAA